MKLMVNGFRFARGSCADKSKRRERSAIQNYESEGAHHEAVTLNAKSYCVISRTTDIADDWDCAYIVDAIDEDKAPGKRKINSRSRKHRGGVAREKSLAYLRREGQSCADLLNSVSVVDQEAAKQEKKLGVNKNKYYADNLLIETISREPLDPNKLIARVSEETGASKADCRKIVDRYEARERDEVVFWGGDAVPRTKTLRKIKLGG